MKSRNKAVWKRQSHKISESKNKYMEVVSLCMFIWIEGGGEQDLFGHLRKQQVVHKRNEKKIDNINVSKNNMEMWSRNVLRTASTLIMFMLVRKLNIKYIINIKTETVYKRILA